MAFTNDNTHRLRDEILIEEMPQGCVIHQKRGTIIIASPHDAALVISSLQKMLTSRNESIPSECFVAYHIMLAEKGDTFCGACGHYIGPVIHVPHSRAARE